MLKKKKKLSAGRKLQDSREWEGRRFTTGIEDLESLNESVVVVRGEEIKAILNPQVFPGE